MTGSMPVKHTYKKLKHVANLYISGEYEFGHHTDGLDDVILSK